MDCTQTMQKWLFILIESQTNFFFIFLLGSYIVGQMVFVNLCTNKMYLSILKRGLWNLCFKYQLLVPLENIQPLWPSSSLIFLTCINREKESLKQKVWRRKKKMVAKLYWVSLWKLTQYYLVTIFPIKLYEKRTIISLFWWNLDKFSLFFFFFWLNDFLCCFLSENW